VNRPFAETHNRFEHDVLSAACECVPLLGGEITERGPRRTLAEQGQDFSAVLVPIREFIADVPALGSDHRKHEPPALREQNLIDVRIGRADLPPRRPPNHHALRPGPPEPRRHPNYILAAYVTSGT
jgi:hypothetical protein